MKLIHQQSQLELRTEAARCLTTNPEATAAPARSAIAGLLAARRGVSLGRLKSQFLIREGLR
jgi:hypothetical protein